MICYVLMSVSYQIIKLFVEGFIHPQKHVHKNVIELAMLLSLISCCPRWPHVKDNETDDSVANRLTVVTQALLDVRKHCFELGKQVIYLLLFYYC